MPLQELFLTAVAFMIAAIPTALPAIDTAILSKGSQMLAAAGAIVKQLRSVETLGSTSALNSDKTGTLTMNQMTAVEMAIVGRRYAISGTGYSTVGQITHAAGMSDVPLEPYLLPMALCSDAEVKDGTLTGDPSEGALVVLAAKGGVDADLTREQYPRVATLPFDAAYKLMATFHDWTDESGRKVVRAYVKGAQDQLLKRAAAVHGPDGNEVPIAQLHDAYVAESDRMGKEGLRLMATGRKDFDPATFDPKADLLKAIDGLTLLALIGITDPPRPAAKAAIATAQAAGVHVRMITGDAALTGAVVAGQLGIPGRAITGAEFAAMSDDEALKEVDGIGVIGRVSPQDKVHLVDVLREQGHIVAMTGDGVNDAPAIKKADIGIAMGITGTAVTKAAADMILADDNYATIIKAISIGRNVYDNLVRFIRFQMAACYGYITVFLGSSLLNILGGVPFLPLQTMWLNFTVNVFQAMGLGFGKPRDGLMAEKPRPKDQALLPRSLTVWLVFCGLVMGVGTLGVIAWANANYGDVVARTMGVATFSLFRIASSLETADETRSVFSGYILGNSALLKATGLSIVTIVLATELGVLRKRAQHDQPHRRAVARLHRGGALAHRGRRGEEAPQGPDGRRAGLDAGGSARGRRLTTPGRQGGMSHAGATGSAPCPADSLRSWPDLSRERQRRRWHCRGSCSSRPGPHSGPRWLRCRPVAAVAPRASRWQNCACSRSCRTTCPSRRSDNDSASRRPRSNRRRSRSTASWVRRRAATPSISPPPPGCSSASARSPRLRYPGGQSLGAEDGAVDGLPPKGRMHPATSTAEMDVDRDRICRWVRPLLRDPYPATGSSVGTVCAEAGPGIGRGCAVPPLPKRRFK